MEYIAICLLVIFAGPPDITLDGPAVAAVNEPVHINVQGLPVVDLAKPLGESLTWTEDFKIVVSAPSKEPPVESVVGVDLLSKRWKLQLTFVPRDPGTYVVIVGPKIVTKRVQVGGTQPNPPLPPPPGPVTSAKVLILRETLGQTPEQAAAIIKLRTQIKSPMDILDKDDSPLYDPSLSLPQLIILDGERVLYKGVFVDVDDTIKKVREYGLR